MFCGTKLRLFSGLPDINIDDLKGNTEYHKYTATSLQIVWLVSFPYYGVPTPSSPNAGLFVNIHNNNNGCSYEYSFS